jgi:hypothetical protein
MRRVLMTILASSAACLASVGLSTAAQAVVLTTADVIATGTPTDCQSSLPGDNGFENCYATQTGVIQGPTTDPLASPTVFKQNFNDGVKTDAEISSMFTSLISGNEFNITLTNGVLNFTYTPDAGDPVLHYLTLKAGNTYDLFYSAVGFTTATFTVSDFFGRTGLSHITAFDTGGPSVPEPATWAMMLLGFGGIGFAMRRGRKQSGRLLQVA